jgi:ATP-dependent DNA ligase
LAGAAAEAAGDRRIAVLCADPAKGRRIIHWVKPDLIAGIEFTSWTQDSVLRQASLQEVREQTDKTLRPNWINLPGDQRVPDWAADL